MKNFNFKINNFYGIFNNMNQEDRNKNLDSFLDSELYISLHSNTSSDFTFELMKRVDLEKEFAKQDMKTSRIARYVIGSVIFLLSAFIIIFASLVSTSGKREDVSFFTNIIDRFTDTVESVSIIIAENLGFAFNYETGLIVLLLMVFVFVFSFADRIIFKKERI